ncbi:M15 family metallopeptidase [Amycolatopsis sp. NPDC088138]|uniref:M15 family metallopeptidase n=1 Tax=Amycolatopsis sp. NPDC088138 TaxID=3363938 RepID=UPI00382B83EB
MPTSQNGFSAPITPVSRDLPGGRVPLRAGVTGDLLAWVGRQFHARVEPLVWPGCWGYAYRDIRGSTGLSNHASGTALDLNAPKHPLGTNPSSNFTTGQISTIHTIVAQTEGCIRWGGDYTGRKDPMHFEINASEARCAAVLAKLTQITPAPTPSEEEDMSVNLKASFDSNGKPMKTYEVVPVNGKRGLFLASAYGHAVAINGITAVHDTNVKPQTTSVTGPMKLDPDRPGPIGLPENVRHVVVEYTADHDFMGWAA